MQSVHSWSGWRFLNAEIYAVLGGNAICLLGNDIWGLLIHIQCHCLTAAAGMAPASRESRIYKQTGRPPTSPDSTNMTESIK
jgi:hypothetical protein